MKKIILIFTLFLATTTIFATKHKVLLKIENVNSEKGHLFISVSNNEKTFKTENAFEKAKIIPKMKITEYELELDDGEYSFAIYHDTNENEKLDSNIFGIPKEPYGFSNLGSKKIPGDFNKHKVLIKEDKIITIPLVQL